MRTGGNDDFQRDGFEDYGCDWCCEDGIAGKTMDECQADGEYFFCW